MTRRGAFGGEGLHGGTGRRGLRATRVVLAALFAMFLVAAGAVVARGLNDQAAHADVIVVPGNKVALDGTPSVRLRARLDAALGAYRRGLAPVVFVSGGTGAEGFDESAVMAGYLIGHGVPAAAVVRDPAGTDTAATAFHAAEYLRSHGGRTALVATQHFHVARTELLLHRQGVRVVGRVHARYVEPRDVYSTAREVVALGTLLLSR